MISPVAPRAFLGASRLGKFIVVLGLFLTPLAAVENRSTPPLALTSGRVLILGDSITQDGRYVTFIEYFLSRLFPAATSDVISIGLSSETLSGLSEKSHSFVRPCVLERLDRALKAVQPKVVIACYGMNDGIYHPPSAERLAAFQNGVKQLIQQVRAAGAQLVLVTPPPFDAMPLRDRVVPLTATEFGYQKPYVDYNTVLAEFAAAERALDEPDVSVIDLHDVIVETQAALREVDATFTFTPDGIHPGDAGHLLIARTILAALGYTDPSLSSGIDLALVMKDPLFTLIRQRRELRSEAWLPYVGYERGERFKSASVAAAEAVVARLQQEIDTLAAR